MFYAIDKITNEIVLSINIRSENYKNSYNKSLRYKCAGCLDNGNNCNDDNVTFVNSIKKQPHFRHSKNTICSASKAFNEFNKDFYLKWFELFKKEYRKPYWFNINLEEISNNKNIIMIKYNHQIEKIIKNIESNVKENNKIIWILSLENRNFNSIKFYKGSIYIDFAGSKNDIPLYNSNKSIIYLDTGFNVLLKIKLENYNSNGQEIEIIYTKDFCKEYDELFIAYPYRKKYNYIDNILDEKNKYNNCIKILLEEYNDTEKKLKISNYLSEYLNNLYALYNIYNKLYDLNYIIEYNYKEEYDICINELPIILKNIKEEYSSIKIITQNTYNLIYYFKNNGINNIILKTIDNIIVLYDKLFNYKEKLNIKFNKFDYIINNDDNIFKEKNKEYNILLEIIKNQNEYILIYYYIHEYNNIIKIIDEYDYICYNYYYNLYIKQQNIIRAKEIQQKIEIEKQRDIQEKLIRQKIETEWKDNKIFNMNEYRQNWAKIYNKI